MSDTPGYGFISPTYIDSLTKELADAKEQNESYSDLLAYLSGEFAHLQCCCGPQHSHGSAPMMWPELVACAIRKAKRMQKMSEGTAGEWGDALVGHSEPTLYADPPVAEMETDNAALKQLLEHEQKFKHKYLAEKERLGDRCEQLEQLLERCLPMLDSLDGELSMDLAEWEDPTGERSTARQAERLECNNLMDEVRAALNA